MFTFISTAIFFKLTLSAFGIGALGSLLLSRKNSLANAWGNGFGIIGSLLGLGAAASVIISQSVFSYNLYSGVFPFSLDFSVDYLSAFFVGAISFVALVASIYATGYVRHYYGKYNIGLLGFFYNIFVASMLAVVTAHNALFFLIMWEVMSLASYFLVIFEHRDESVIKAGSLYFIMTHVGTAFIILAFLLMYKLAGSFDFTAIKLSLATAPALFKSLIFVFALIGFGTKAGVIPLHSWLPSAHPAAPSHVSSLMSGVMIKTGIYMMIRIFFDLLPGAPLWWGEVVLALGAISALLGVLYALTEHDIKRLLAYHSIENIGIILLGVGGALIFTSLGLPTLAAVSLVAALFHTLNHAIFKALLFLGAGGVISQTHTRNMEEYGGLVKKMPQTAFLFLVGSMAISALPPFNGFFSEWLTFQSLFYGLRTLTFSGSWIFIIGAGSLAFTGGLAAACFVKAFGATFLARPRSAEVEHAREVGWPLRLGMSVLALATLALGVFSGAVVKILTLIAAQIGIAGAFEPIAVNGGAVTVPDGFATVSMPIVFVGLLVGIILATGVVYLFTRKRIVTKKITWDCGQDLSPRMEMTSTGFARSIVVIFRGILKPSKQTTVEYQDSETRYFPKSSHVTLEIQDIYQTYFYKPLVQLLTKIASYVKRIQSGNINAYILYVFVTLLALIYILAS